MRNHQAAVGRDVVRRANGQGALHKVGFIAGGSIVILAHGQLIVPDPLTQHIGHRRKGHGKTASGTIGFNDGDIQVATQGARVNIAQGKGPWRHVGAVDGVPVLANLNPRTGLRHAMYDRGIATQTFRQHVIGARQLHAPELDTVKDIAVGVGLADYQAAAQGHNIGFCPGRNVIEAGTGT